MAIEYSGMGGVAPLAELAKATGRDVQDVVELAAKNELRRLFPNGRTYHIKTVEPPAICDSDLLRTRPRQAQLRLMCKRYGPQ